MRIREDEVRWENGTPGSFAVAEFRPGSTVLPYWPDGRVRLVREFKYGVGDYTLEAMSGGMNDGESPLDAARRELREELGLTASDWRDYGYLHPLTSILSVRNYLFVARGLTDGAAAPDATEQIEPVEMTLAQAAGEVLAGRITHAASCLLILRLAREVGV